ncbi:MAG: holo-ACP synthase [Leptospiraceae bacterium]|nr:holo-ACP synthase [Leptospiraceae bacterium]MDW8306807.1 holo-ACP synthase [Leptospiraceae bacterium]
MIVGIGTDICENERIRSLWQIYGQRFLERIFHEEEIHYCLAKKNPVPHLSGRFAVKEAFIKALGLSRTLHLSYREIYLSGRQGRKELRLSGILQEIFHDIGAQRVHFSISHTRHYSTAVVILEKDHGL